MIRFIRPRSKPRPGRLKGKALEALRWECYERDGRRCVDCKRWLRWLSGYEDSMEMSHVRNKRMWGDSLENVVTRCGFCHRNSHNAGGKPVPLKIALILVFLMPFLRSCNASTPVQAYVMEIER